MTTLILGEHPDVVALIRQRQDRGLDGHDEVWDGVYHVVPHGGLWHGVVQTRLGAVLDLIATSRGLGLAVSAEFNLGVKGNYRVPDLGVHRSLPDQTYVPTAAMVVEVLSRDDETFEKFPFYAAQDVDEIMVVDAVQRTIRIWQLTAQGYVETGFCTILGVPESQVAAALTWPGD